MKRFLVFIIGVLVASVSLSAQSFVRNDKVYSSVKAETKSKDVNTGFTWKDSKGETYEIYITSNNACYIWRISKKTGKKYKMYLPKDVSADIAYQLGRSKSVNYD